MALTVSALATQAGLSADTVRYYERVGLLPPPDRSAAGYRLYDQDALGRLRLIRGAQRAGCGCARSASCSVADRASCPAGHRDPARGRLAEVRAELERLPWRPSSPACWNASPTRPAPRSAPPPPAGGAPARSSPSAADSLGASEQRPPMARIAVTGGSGPARGVRRPARARAPGAQRRPGPLGRVEQRRLAGAVPAADLTDFGQTLEALSGAEVLPGIQAVVHLAAIPSPVHATPDTVFGPTSPAPTPCSRPRPAWAWSGWCGRPARRPSASPSTARPTTRPSTRPTSCAPRPRTPCPRSWARRWPASCWTGIPFLGLRFSNIMTRADYQRFPVVLGRPGAAQVEPVGLRGLLARGPGRAPRPGGRGGRGRGVHHRRRRHRHAAAQPGADGGGVPGVPVKGDLATHGTLLGIDKARRLLGYDPEFTWRSLF